PPLPERRGRSRPRRRASSPSRSAARRGRAAPRALERCVMVRLAFVLLLLAPVTVAAQGTRAPVRLGELESVGALDTKTAKDRISKVLPQLRACVVGEDGKSRVSGIARYRALVVADGTMIATEVASSSLGDRSIERCL